MASLVLSVLLITLNFPPSMPSQLVKTRSLRFAGKHVADYVGEHEHRRLHFSRKQHTSTYGWQKLKSGPKRMFHTAVVYNHQMIVFGGYDEREVTQ